MRNKVTKKKYTRIIKKNNKTKNKKFVKRKSKKYNKKKSKKIKKGGIKLIEEENVTKKDNRWKNEKEKYDKLKKTSCDKIYSYEDLIKRLQQNFTGKPGLDSTFKNNYKLFPYCNEELKGPASVDKVNAPFTSLEALYSFYTVFNANFVPINPVLINGNYTSQEKLSNSEGAVSSKNDPSMFIKTLESTSGNCFIVSHSGFMTKLYDHIINEFLKYEEKTKILKEPDDYGDIYNFKVEDPNFEDFLIQKGLFGGGLLKKMGLKKERNFGVFDNLDILHLLIDKFGKIKYLLVRRYSNNYQLKEEETIDYDKINYKSVFIMRHCLGCHNVTPGITRKIGQAIKQAKTGENLGYLDWSLCFEDTIDEMVKVRVDLNKLLEKYGGFNSYTFGSSVIFRAILTSILQYNILKNINENTSETYNDPELDDSIVSGLTQPRDPEED